MSSTVARRPARRSTRDNMLQLVAEAQVQVGASVRTFERLRKELAEQFEALAELTTQMEEERDA